MTPIKSSYYASILLMGGSVLVLISILFEYQIGWLIEGRSASETRQFMLNNWANLSQIWFLQMLGYVGFSVAFLLLTLRLSGMLKLLFSLLFIGSLMLITGMAITLIKYEATLSVYATQPEIHEAVRSVVMPIYTTGRTSLILLVMVLLFEMFKGSGKIPVISGSLIIGFFAICVIIGIFTNLPIKLLGASAFLVPFFIGFHYFQNQTKQVTHSPDQ